MPCGWGDLLEGGLEFGLGGDPVGDEFGRCRLPDAVDPEEIRFRHTRWCGDFYTRIAFSPSVLVISTVLAVGLLLSLPDYESPKY